jgi:hypothetical protein
MNWTDGDEKNLVLAIVMGLRKGMKAVRGLRKQVSEPEEFLIGQRIAEQLRTSNYKIEQGPPLAGHGAGWEFKP